MALHVRIAIQEPHLNPLGSISAALLPYITPRTKMLKAAVGTGRAAALAGASSCKLCSPSARLPMRTLRAPGSALPVSAVCAPKLEQGARQIYHFTTAAGSIPATESHRALGPALPFPPVQALVFQNWPLLAPNATAAIAAFEQARTCSLPPFLPFSLLCCLSSFELSYSGRQRLLL